MMFNFNRFSYDQYIAFKQKKSGHQTQCTIFHTISAGMCTYLPRGVTKKFLELVSRDTFTFTIPMLYVKSESDRSAHYIRSSASKLSITLT